MTEEWVCKGWRWTVKGSVGIFFCKPDGSSAGFKLHKGSVAASARPGSVFEVDTESGKFIRYVRTEKSERVEEWIIESETVDTEAAAKIREKKDAEMQTVKALVEPIRQFYRSSITPAQRRAVLAVVMEAITR